MRILQLIYEKAGIVFINIFSAFLLSIFLKILKIPNQCLYLILFCWFCILTSIFVFELYKENLKLKQIEQHLQKLDQKYLIAELIKPDTQLESIYFNMLRLCSKSMLEEISTIRNSQISYKEYIEEWIHEIKTPITAIDLICKNRESEESKRIAKELLHINYLVEQALYYARSEHVEKDYFVKEFRLFDGVQTALLSNRTILLEKHICLEIEESEDIIYTDEKWFIYILNQLILNAIKYQKSSNGKLHIYSTPLEKGISLIIEDNGIGISEEDLPRLYEKGFTGSNRSNNKSTGIGLYLCNKLCNKLGLDLKIISKISIGTKVMISFPVGKMHRP